MINENKFFSLRAFLFHGDFENISDDFDVFDELKESDKEESRVKPPHRTEETFLPKFEDPLLDEAYQFSKEDEILKLLRDTLWEIREFEMELDNSLEQLNSKFDKNEYQYYAKNFK